MKKFLLILALLGLAVTAMAQTYGVAPVITWVGTNIFLPARTGTNVAVLIDARKQASVGVASTARADAAGTDALRFHFQRSVDGTTYDAGGMDGQVVALALNGTTATTTFTNIPSNGCGYIRLNWITNASASQNITNLTVKYGLKIQSP
jgi:hypothetical protein